MSESVFVLFVRVCVVARVLRLSCCAFRFPSRWVLHELSVCDAIYLSRTVNIDSLFLADFFLICYLKKNSGIFCFPSYFHSFCLLLLFRRRKTKCLALACCWLLFCSSHLLFLSLVLAAASCFLSFFFPVHFLAMKSASDVYISLTPLLLWEEDCYFRDVSFV